MNVLKKLNMVQLNYVISLVGLNNLSKEVKQQRRKYRYLKYIVECQLIKILNYIHTLLFWTNLQIYWNTVLKIQ